MPARSLACALLLQLVAAVAAAQTAPTLTGTERRITTDPWDQWDPAISGDIVVYTDLRGSDLDVWYYDLATNTEEPATLAPGDQQLADVSGQKIVFSDYNTGDTMLFNVGDRATVDLTQDTTAPAYDPAVGGSLIAWIDSRDGSTQIYATDLVTGEVRRLTANPPDTTLRRDTPAVGDGVIVWKECASYCDIYAYDWASGTMSQVTATPAVNESSPDVGGGKVVYDAVVNGDSDIYVFDRATGLTRQLARPGTQVNPNLSGDFVSFEELEANWLYHVKLWQLSTDLVFDLTELPNGPPATASQYLNDIDGHRVVYTDDRNGQLDIYVYEFAIETPGDSTPPVITIGGCPTEPLTLRAEASVTVEVADPESGIASQTVPNGPSTLDTAAVGAHTLTVTATNGVGLGATASCAYQVVYDFAGFLPSVANPPAVNSAKAGRAVPVKFQIPDGMGGFVSSLAAVHSITFGQVSAFGEPPGSEIEEWVEGEGGLRYDPQAQQFVYVWKTERSLAGKSYALLLQLNDGGMVHMAYFALR